MDTSKEYIKMCEKAWGDLRSARISVEKMPSLWLFEENNGQQRLLLDFYTKTMDNLTPICRIYRQDQLQEMVVEQFNNWKDEPRLAIYHLLERFDNWATRNSEFVSMEQLWLAFVMKEKYNKTWNGEEWKNV